MKLSDWFIIPFLLQGLAMMVDEFYYHRKRGLPKWERLGHPIDTLSVLACYVFISYALPTSQNIAWFIGLSLFSCVLVTKDEFEHQKYCTGGEQWLHAVLFVLHPLVFGVAGLIWYQQSIDPLMSSILVSGLQMQIYLTVGFLIYQITYWNLIWKTDQK